MTDLRFKPVVALVGRTNVGKSTLLNALIGQKVSIVSDKPQTTRNNIRLIRTTETSQMVFIDTPGFHKPKTKLGTFMVDAAGASVRDVDLVLLLVEEEAFIGKGDRMVLDKLASSGVPVILVINKIDKVPKEELLKKIELFKEFPFLNEIIPISALKSENVDTLVASIESYLPEGPMFFPDDMVTDRAERFLVQELIREKILRFLEQEVPHGVAVEVMSMKERPNGTLTDIDVNIYCERKSHKGILIGKNGEMLKKIGTAARRDIEDMLDAKVNLSLWVKVRDDWRDRPYDLNDLGYTKDDE